MSISESRLCPHCASPLRHLQTQLLEKVYNDLTEAAVISASWECGSERVGERVNQTYKCLELEFGLKERELVGKF